MMGSERRLTPLQLFLALTLAIFLGGFALFFSAKLYLDYEAKVNAEAMAKELREHEMRRKAEAALRANRARIAAEEAERKAKEKAEQEYARMQRQRRADAAARQTLRQTCDFWRSTYRKTGRDYDRMMRDQACARL